MEASNAFPGSGNLRIEDAERRQLKREIDVLRRERDILKKHWPSFPHRKAKIPIYAKQCGSMEGRGNGAFVRGFS
jgi:hypothetical protein